MWGRAKGYVNNKCAREVIDYGRGERLSFGGWCGLVVVSFTFELLERAQPYDGAYSGKAQSTENHHGTLAQLVALARGMSE